jgi:SOS-response transcriptional repressor LexA
VSLETTAALRLLENVGSATIFAEENFHGFLRVSSKLIGRSKPSGLYAVKADGTSMNRADIGGRKIFDGDFVIVNSQKRNVIRCDVVLAVIDPCMDISC